MSRKPKASRAIYGQGSVRYDEQRDLWVGEIARGVDHRGKRARTRVYARDREECLGKLRAAQRKIDDGTLPSSTVDIRTVGEWLEHWATTIAPTTAPKSWENSYSQLRRWVLKYPIARTPLTKFRAEHVDRHLKRLELDVGLGPASRAKVRELLSRAFTVAEQRGIVPRNEVRLSAAPKVRRRTSDAMTDEQIDKVLATARAGVPDRTGWRPSRKGHKAELRPDPLYALAVLVLAVGMRQAECLDLRWSDVDLRARTLDVVDAKTEAGIRQIPLPELVVDALTAHRASQRTARIASDVWAEPDLVFATSVGTRIGARNCLRWWHDLTERAGVGRRRFHASRHTAATYMLNHGVPLEVVSAILGHARLSITADIYAKPRLAMLRQAADVIDASYSERRNLRRPS